MFVTRHASDRLVARMGKREAGRLVGALETHSSRVGSYAYIVGVLPDRVRADDGSNGDVIVAIARDGSVETVFYRRSSQDLSAAFFGVREVIDLRASDVLYLSEVL